MKILLQLQPNPLLLQVLEANPILIKATFGDNFNAVHHAAGWQCNDAEQKHTVVAHCLYALPRRHSVQHLNSFKCLCKPP